MDALQHLGTWIAENPGTAAWILVGFLTACVALYHRLRPTIKVYVDQTTVTWDDGVVDRLDAFFSGVDWLVGLIEIVLPAVASRGRRGAPGQPPPPPRSPS